MYSKCPEWRKEKTATGRYPRNTLLSFAEEALCSLPKVQPSAFTRSFACSLIVFAAAFLRTGGAAEKKNVESDK